MGEFGDAGQNAALSQTESRSKERKNTTSEVLEKLKPQKIVDTEGNSRDVYTFTSKAGNKIKTIFYSPEELPFSHDTLKGNLGFILGQKPKWRSDTDWSTFVSQVATTSERRTNPLIATVQYPAEAVQANKAVYFVESTPTSLLDLAFTLGVEDKVLRNARLDASHNKITEAAQKLTDDVIAGKVIDDDGNIKNEKDYQGEALAVLSLMGDTEAMSLLKHKKTQLKNLEDNNKEKDLQKQRDQIAEGRRVEPLKLQDLVAVHTTRYQPKRNGDQWEVQSTFDATNGKGVRQSIHFSLNHAVEGHMYGSWEGAQIVIISPLNKIIEQNGTPTLLNTVDTFFEVSPGTTLKLPQETTIIKPGKTNNGELFVEMSREIHYKSRKYTPEDVEHLAKSITKDGKYYTNDHISRLITEKLQWDQDYMRDDGSNVFTQEELGILFDSLGGFQTRDLLSELGKSPITGVLRQIFTEAGINDRIKDTTINALEHQIELKFSDIVKKQAVNTALEKMGYTVHSGGMWAWGDSFTVTFQTAALADQIGTLVGAHTGHISHRLQEGFMGGWGGAGLLTLLQAGEITPKEYRERAREFVKPLLPELSQASRRMLYTIGAI